MVETDVERESAKQNALSNGLRERLAVEIEVIDPLGEVQHTFSHLQWNMQVWSCDWIEGDDLPPNARFVAVDELDTYTFPMAHHKIRELMQQKSDRS
jgi:A/G-specific adenine glycosylase